MLWFTDCGNIKWWIGSFRNICFFQFSNSTLSNYQSFQILFRLPKFKSEVKKVLQLPIPACLANYIPGMADMTITAYSSCNRQSTPKRQRKEGKNSPNCNSDLRRNKSMPEPSSGSEARCDTPRRIKSAKSPSAVRFSSMGLYPSTPQNVTPDR